MRTPHWIGVVVLALLVGGAIGNLTSPRNPSEPAIVKSRDPAEIEGQSEGKPIPMWPSNQESNPESEPDDDSTSESDFAESARDAEGLKAVLRKIPPYPREEGDRKITGSITDGAGNPISGVRVTALAMRGSGNDYLLRVWDFEERELWEGLVRDVTKLVRLRTYHFNEKFTGVTNSQGQYEISGLTPENTLLSASLDGYRFETLNNQSYHRPDAVVDWVGYRAYPITIKVVQPGGGEPPAGRAEVIDLSTYRREYTGLRGEGTEWSVHLEPGVYSFQVTYSSLQTKTDSQIVTVRPVESSQEVILSYDPGEMLTVNIDRALLGFEAVTISCGPDDPGREAKDVLDSLHQPELRTQNVYNTMPATFRGLIPGKYVIGVKLSGRWAATKRVEYIGGRLETDLIIERPPPDECITCRVTTPGMRRLLYPKFWIQPDRGDRVGLTAWPSGNQTFLLQLPSLEEFDRMQGGKLYMEDQQLGSVQIALTSLVPQSVDMIVRPTGFLVVTWDEERFLNGEKPVVRLLNAAGELVREERVWHTNALPNGLVVTKLQPGNYTMEVVIGWRSKLPLYRGAIEIVEGFNESAPDLAETYDVVVKAGIEEISHFELVWTVGGEERVERIHLRNDSKAALSSVPAGQYVIRYKKRTEPEPREIQLVVPGTDTIYLD